MLCSASRRRRRRGVVDGLDAEHCIYQEVDGATLDPAANQEGTTLISRAGSRVRLYVVPTDEELMIARDTARLIAAIPDQPPRS